MTPCVLLFCTLTAATATPTPEERAIAFLAREVPRWSAENKCYSCHNNGDAARALYTAKRLGYTVPDKALADTTNWLQKPTGWDKNGGEGPFSDKVLARIQFAAALVEAQDAGVAKDKDALASAANILVKDQQKDGSWTVDAEGTLGSPATYGAYLVTYMARRTLHKADPKLHAAAIGKADQWLLKREPKTVLDASALLLALTSARRDAPDPSARRGSPDPADQGAAAQQQRCLDLIRTGQSKDGGWGPYVNSAPEPFDTAVVLLALARLDDRESKALRERGRAYLLSTQQKDGSWSETTRPAGGDSYAQRLSTTGWATSALLLTSDERRAVSPP